jgi:type IV pilus assembly protein PilB
MARKKLGEMLVEAGVLSEQGLRMALGEQRRWGGTLGRTLVEMKLVSESGLVQVLAQQLHLPAIDLDDLEIHPTVLELVPGELAEQHNLVPFAQPMKFLDVAMVDPTNLGVIDELRIRTQLNIRPYLAGPKMIERAIGKHYRRGIGRLHIRSSVPLESAMDVEPGPARPRSLPATADLQAEARREGIRPFPRKAAPLVGPDALPTSTASTDAAGPPAIASTSRDAEIDALQHRISTLEALVARDENVLRGLLALLVEKGVATREEILARLGG